MSPKLAILVVTAAGLYGQQAPAQPQTATALDQILDRLERLENENRKLLEEVRELRRELAPAATPAAGPEISANGTQSAPLAERVDILERRSEEVDQDKVQAGQRYPVTINGMALFNAYSNGRYSGGAQNPLAASFAAGPDNDGATFRQTVIGLRFNGPETFAGGKVSGALDMDLWGGDSTSLNHLLRLRTATIRLDWTNTSVSVGQDKPLIAPRDPDSLAQVAFSPLTAAGNPWLWQPQVRVEQRFAMGEDSGVLLQGSVYQTRESLGNLPASYQSASEVSRPGYEGRAEYWKHWGDHQRLEIASGFHLSFSKVEGVSIPSNAVSFDWLVDPLPRWEITGAYYHGQNLGTIGGGAGITLLPSDTLVGVHQNSGWVQTSFRLTPRLKLNGFAGEQSDRAADLLSGALRSNLAWGGNLMYHLAPNVIASFEALQLRTRYLNTGLRINDHYDLALAYLF
jgi:hypothetical protein